MGLYERYCLPHLVDLACSAAVVREQRAKIVPLAHGRVLEVGMGSGRNLPYYDAARVEMVFGLEPSAGMRAKARRALARAPFEVRWLDLPGEQVPLDDASVDTVLLTYTLCTIADWRSALEQMRRVLRPGGALLFCEHGEAPDERVRRWQRRLNPAWKRVAGGCNLDRAVPACLDAGGFRIERMDTRYLKAPRLFGFNYRGVARAR